MSSMKAIVTVGDTKKVALRNVPIPSPGPGQVLVQVIAAAQNPAEWMVLERLKTSDIVLGHDFAGVVKEVGPQVPADLVRVGQRVAGFIFGGVDPKQGGSFGEYCVADAQLLIHLPDNLPFEDASTLAHAGLTASQALWLNKDLPTPIEPANSPFPILIWGGATTVGQLAIQLGKQSGLHVITTASPKNHELLKKMGADAVYDYRDLGVVEKIRKEWGTITHAVDCASTIESARLTVEVVAGSQGAHVSFVLVQKSHREDVESDFALVHTLLGKALSWPYSYPAMPEHYELGKRWLGYFTKLLAEGKLQTTPVRVVPNGLADAEHWIQYQRDGKVSAEKIVYRPADTL